MKQKNKRKEIKMINSSWKEGDVGTYPMDYGYETILEIPEKVATCWVETMFPMHKSINKRNGWLNKLFIIIIADYSGTFALYNHDCKYYIIKMRAKS